eukprot:COSAG01_NODE_1652_length_9619_cov_9.589181_9_plen_246_part_00
MRKGLIDPKKTPWWPKWCLLQFVLLMYIGFVVPYRVCFDDRSGTGREGGWYIFDFWVDLCFMFDTWLLRRTFRRDHRSGELVTDFFAIKAHYKRTLHPSSSYYLDVITALPIHTVINIFVWMFHGALVEDFERCIGKEERNAVFCGNITSQESCDAAQLSQGNYACNSIWKGMGGDGDMPWTYDVAHYIRFVKLLRLAKFPVLASTFYNRADGPYPSQFCGYLGREVAEIGWAVLFAMHILVCLW